MLNNWIGAVAAAGFLLSGCAQNASKIETAEISPIAYQGLSCKQIAEEAQHDSLRVGTVSGAQNKAAKNDSIAIGVAWSSFGWQRS